MDRTDHVVGQAGRVCGIVFENGGPVPVVAHQAIVRSQPEIADAILGDGIDRPLGQAVTGVQVAEADVLFRKRRPGMRGGQQKSEDGQESAEVGSQNHAGR
jgi:hypothetical protein